MPSNVQTKIIEIQQSLKVNLKYIQSVWLLSSFMCLLFRFDS